MNYWRGIYRSQWPEFGHQPWQKITLEHDFCNQTFLDYELSTRNASAGDILDAFQAGNMLASKVKKIDNPITTKTSLKFIFEGNVDKK